MSERSVISRLVWRANDNRIVEYGSQSTTYFVHHNRIILSERNFTLFFRPVQSEDSGEYQCIVNSRNIPEVIVNLTVQGKKNNKLIYKYILTFYSFYIKLYDKYENIRINI